jgi:hypothetical protein
MRVINLHIKKVMQKIHRGPQNQIQPVVKATKKKEITLHKTTFTTQKNLVD